VDLGKLGELQLAPRDINNQAQVVGFAFAFSPTTTFVAFLWQNGVATNLGTLPPDVFSFALGINDKGQIVGDSCDMSFACRAFLWQDGTMTELDSLVQNPNAPFLENGNGINSRGQIAGKTTVQGTPIADAFLATPSHGEDTSDAASPARHGQTSQRPRVVLPETVRRCFSSAWAIGIAFPALQRHGNSCHEYAAVSYSKANGGVTAQQE
jgi:probable HAF family extracellular repeat protein